MKKKKFTIQLEREWNGDAELVKDWRPLYSYYNVSDGGE